MNTTDKITSIDVVISKAKELIKEDFIEFVNTREFEKSITNIAKKLDDTFFEFDSKIYIDEYIESNKPLAFNIFFIFYTFYRRNSFGNLSEYCDKYIERFSEYEITKHIKILTCYADPKNNVDYEILISRTDKLINEENSKFKTHAGVLNLYSALVCAYYEKNLDLREEENDKQRIEKALEYTNFIIKMENYDKYHLNKGRLLVLLKKYNEGEQEIHNAIKLVGNPTDRESRIRLYEHYINKASIIYINDLNNEKFKELDKIKNDNYKTISITTGLIGYLIGTINIFKTETDSKTLVGLLLIYFSILVIFTGIILTGISIMSNEKKKDDIKPWTIMIIVGVIIFLISAIIFL